MVYVTREQFIERPEREDDQREELIEGELLVSPPAKIWHADIVRRLRVSLTPLEQKGYVLANDFACTLGEISMPAPDLAAVQMHRWENAVSNDGWLHDSPELVIEVASPSNRKLERKAALYFEHGAEQVWIVYRKTKTVAVLMPESTTEARLGETLEFHGIQVPVAAIFPTS